MSSNRDLFKWQKSISRPLESQRKSNAVKDWIKRVQYTSEVASRDAYGTNILTNDERKMNIIPDDEAVYEAQLFVDEWLKEKPLSAITQELEYQNERWAKTTGLTLDPDLEVHESPVDCVDILRSKWFPQGELHESVVEVESGQERYADHVSYVENVTSDDIEDTLLVNAVLSDMMDKQYVKHFDLGMKPLVKKVKDPTHRMNYRHQKVQQQRADRLKNNSKEKVKSEKEISKIAQERIQMEEKEKKRREVAEEAAIKKEMTKIKLQLEEEKRKQIEKIEKWSKWKGLLKNENKPRMQALQAFIEEVLRERQTLQDVKSQIREELRKKKEEEQRQKQNRKIKEDEMRKLVEKEVHEKSMMEMKLTMKLLYKCFIAWHNLVLESRLNMGKAQTLANWKSKLKAWNAWRLYHHNITSSQAVAEMELYMKEKFRKEKMSVNYYHSNLKRKCMKCWLMYTRKELEKKYIRIEHEQKAKKMAMFLEKASKGLLWNKDDSSSDDSTGENNTVMTSREQSKSQNKEKVNMKVISRENKNLQIFDQVKNKISYSEKNLKEKEHRKRRTLLEKQTGKMSKIRGINRSNTSDESRNARSCNTPQEILNIDLSSLDGEDTKRAPSKLLSTLSTRKPVVKSDRPATKPLHLAMEEREKMRRERKTLVEENKRLKEQARMEELREKEAERIRLEEQEKQERILKKREEKKKQQEKEREKQVRIELEKHKLELAKQHYSFTLIRKYGIEPLRRIVEISQLNFHISEKYRNSNLLRCVMLEWNDYTKAVVIEKNKKSDDFFVYILLQRSFRSWQKCRFHLQNLNKTALAHSKKRMKMKVFKAWQDHVTDERILMWSKESQADDHNDRRMKKVSFTAWKSFVQEIKEERKREVRRNELRKKVQSWLPDFNSSQT